MIKDTTILKLPTFSEFQINKYFKISKIIIQILSTNDQLLASLLNSQRQQVNKIKVKMYINFNLKSNNFACPIK